MKTIIRYVGAVCLVLSIFAPSALARKRHRRAVWGLPEIFSDLGLEPETGDVGGMEVILVPVDSGEWATVVTASGIAYDPVLIRVTRDRNNIEFTLPERDGSPSSECKGRITRAGLTLRCGGEVLGLLRRQAASKYR